MLKLQHLWGQTPAAEAQHRQLTPKWTREHFNSSGLQNVKLNSLILHVHKNVRVSRNQKDYHFNQISALSCDAAEAWNPCCRGGLEKGTQQVVPYNVFIPDLQVFLLPQSLSSLVKGKSICTDEYEDRKIAQRRRRKAFWWRRQSKNKGRVTCYRRACAACLFARLIGCS